MSDANPFAALQNAAEVVRRQLRLTTYDAPAVQRLAGFIEEQRAGVAEGSREGLVTALGCFLGQCLVQTYGGQWAAGPDGSTGVGVGGTTFFNPFYRVAEQLTHGRPQSVAAFFAAIPQRVALADRKNPIS